MYTIIKPLFDDFVKAHIIIQTTNAQFKSIVNRDIFRGRDLYFLFEEQKNIVILCSKDGVNGASVRKCDIYQAIKGDISSNYPMAFGFKMSSEAPNGTFSFLSAT